MARRIQMGTMRSLVWRPLASSLAEDAEPVRAMCRDHKLHSIGFSLSHITDISENVTSIVMLATKLILNTPTLDFQCASRTCMRVDDENLSITTPRLSKATPPQRVGLDSCSTNPTLLVKHPQKLIEAHFANF